MNDGLSTALVVAMAKNRVIGRDNDMPWHIPEDLKRFKALTMGHPVVMGRKTFDSIVARLGKPLPGRVNIVVSRHLHDTEGALVCPTLDQALEAARMAARAAHQSMVFIIGGAQIYAQSLPVADRIYLTEIDSTPEGDAFFPEIDPKIWHSASSETHDGFTFRTLVRAL